jgi:four helix bundle protein
MKDFRQLEVWVKSHQLALSIYKDTQTFPDTEKFGLTNQIRRACFSIPTNIAEGCGRNVDGDFARFLEIAMGSASETDYLILLSHDLGFMKEGVYKLDSAAITSINQMLYSLINKVKPSRRPS